MARRKATRQATELTMVEAYYMLYGYVTVYLLVDKAQLEVKNVMTNHNDGQWNVSHRLFRRLNNATGQCPVVC